MQQPVIAMRECKKSVWLVDVLSLVFDRFVKNEKCTLCVSSRLCTVDSWQCFSWSNLFCSHLIHAVSRRSFVWKASRLLWKKLWERAAVTSLHRQMQSLSIFGRRFVKFQDTSICRNGSIRRLGIFSSNRTIECTKWSPWRWGTKFYWKTGKKLKQIFIFYLRQTLQNSCGRWS